MNEIINLTATNASLTVSDPATLPLLTSGMRNHVLCKFSCSDAWNTLSKVATFRAGDQRVSVLPEDWIDEDTVAVPAKVLAASGYLVHVGLYGFSGAPENIIIPTVEADIGVVRTGADPAGDTPGEDAMPLWVQMKKEVGNLDNLVTEDKSSVVAAINEAVRTGGQKLPISVADGALCITYKEE